jgi:hypothetical protein
MIQEELKLENEWMRKFYKDTKIMEFLSIIIKEEKAIYSAKQETNILLCKQRIVLNVKKFLKEVVLLMYQSKDEKTRKKILKIIDTLPVKTILNNLESLEKKKTQINRTDIHHEDDRKVCEKFIYKTIQKSMNDRYRKIYEALGMQVPNYLK